CRRVCPAVIAQNYRPVLMNAKNRFLPRLTGSMENRNYTVEPWRASKTAAVRLSPGRLEKLHFNQDGIKRGRVAQVREFFGRKHIYVAVSGCKFCPVELCRHHSRRNCTVH